MVFKNKTDSFNIIKIGSHYQIELITTRAVYEFFMFFSSREEALNYLKYSIGPHPSLSVDEWRYHSYRGEEEYH